ncbi:MAG: ornithine carbamoyltransferase [Geminicoccaceae bacterium]
MSAPIRHFLDLDAVDAAPLRDVLTLAGEIKQGKRSDAGRLLAGRTLAMIFERPSTRTRVSFEIAIKKLGGDAVVLSAKEMQLGRGETVADTAHVLSRYVDAIMVRTDCHDKLLQLAESASVPVINGLSDRSHPCQVMADVFTFEERLGPIRKRKLAWIGDGNNVATSFIHAAQRFDFELAIACPQAHEPAAQVIAWAKERQARVSIVRDPYEAVRGADAIITDTWVSMGDERAEQRRAALAPYQVTGELMNHAGEDAIFMHCLPAHRGEEMTAAVIDGPRSVVWDEAENRLHVQKGILAWCLA